MYHAWSLLSRISWNVYRYFDNKRVDYLVKHNDWLDEYDEYEEI
jgi:hypothetical protein